VPSPIPERAAGNPAAVALAEQLGGERQPELAPAVAALAVCATAQQAAARHHLPEDWRALQAVPAPR